MPSWHLADAEVIAAENPFTFSKPSKACVDLVQPGDFVKLIFNINEPSSHGPCGERMWVCVSRRLEDGSLEGLLDNDPQFIADLAIGMPVAFDHRHVIMAPYEDPVPDLVEKYLPRCLVANSILDGAAKVGRLLRVEPKPIVGEYPDSGWRIFAGHEPDNAHLDPKANALTQVSLGSVLRQDPRIMDLLESPVGSGFRSSANGEIFTSETPEEFRDNQRR